MGRENDKNLLFAVLAVQLKGLSPERVMEMAVAWSVDPTKSLAEHLRARNLLTDEDVQLLDRLTEETVAACGDDAERALESISGGATLRRSIAGVRPRPAQDTIPMGEEFPYAEEVELSGVQETPGRYSQISEYARGGMGRVLLVHDAHLGRDIALKELLIPHEVDKHKPSTAVSPMRESAAVLERFLQEARITGQLEHPAIVPVYELGRRDNGTLYYTMRLVRGATLSVSFAECEGLQSRLGLLRNVVDLCHALSYAHSRGVIHRDIKPSNIMVGEFGETVLLDWGLAKARGHEDLFEGKLQDQVSRLVKPGQRPLDTREGDVIGTPHYMPPEQAQGMISALDERSDIYSVGAVLYELLAGRPPYRGATAPEVLGKVLAGPPEPLRTLDPELPPELVSICEKCMARAPEARYPRMKDVADELTRFQTGAFVKSYRYSAPEVLRRWYHAHRLVLNTAAAGLLALLAVGIFSYVSIWQARNREHTQRLVAEDARAHEAVARKEAEEARDRVEVEHYYAQLNLAQARREDQEYAAATNALWRIAPKRRDWVWGMLLNACNPDKFTIRENRTVLFSDWQPGGQYLITLSDDGRPRLWNGISGELVRAFDVGSAVYNTACFNAAGDLFAAAGNDGKVSCWRVADGSLQFQTGLPSNALGIAFDAAAPWVWAGYEDGYLRALSIDSGAPVHAVNLEAGSVGVIQTLPGGGLVLANTSAGQIVAYDVEGGEVRYAMEAHAIQLSLSGKYLLLAKDAQAGLYDPQAGALMAPVNVTTDAIFSARFSGAEDRVSIASLNNMAFVADTASGAILQQFYMDQPVFWTFFTDADSRLVVCQQENQYTVFDLASGATLLNYAGEGPFLNVAQPTADGRSFLAVPATKHMQVFEATRPTGTRYLFQVAGADGALLSAVTAPGDSRFAATWADGALHLFDASMGLIGTISNASGHAARADFFPGEARIAYVGDAYLPQIVDWDTGEVVQHFPTDTPIRAILAAETGDYVLTGGDSGTITQWDVSSGESIQLLPADSPTYALARTPEPQIFASGHEDGYVRFWDMSTGTLVREVHAHDGPCASMDFSPDGRIWASLGYDDTVQLWDRTTHERLLSYAASSLHSWQHIGIYSVHFFEDSRFLGLNMAGQPGAIISTETADVVFREASRGSAIHMAKGGAQAMRFATGGSVTYLTLPPEDVTAAPSADARVRYMQYKQRSQSWVPRQDVFRQIALVNPAHVEGALQELRRQTAAAESPSDSLALTGKPLPVSLQFLGLRAGDLLTRIAGSGWQSADELVQTLEAVTASLAGRSEPLSMTVLRGTQTVDVLINLVPQREEVLELTLDRQRAQALIAFMTTSWQYHTAQEVEPPGFWWPGRDPSYTTHESEWQSAGLVAMDSPARVGAAPALEKAGVEEQLQA